MKSQKLFPFVKMANKTSFDLIHISARLNVRIGQFIQECLFCYEFISMQD